MDDHPNLEGARRACGAEKKILNDALFQAARGKAYQHARLYEVQVAKLINLHSGGAVIAPWEVSQLDQEWLDVFFGLLRLPELKKQAQAFEKRLNERRAANPHYRKYLKNG